MFARDRSGYLKRLRQAVLKEQVNLLTCAITWNHVHLLVHADEPHGFARMMQQAAGEFARDYNRRKRRTGAFWDGRYHVTMVDSAQYLWECLNYIDVQGQQPYGVNEPGFGPAA